MQLGACLAEIGPYYDSLNECVIPPGQKCRTGISIRVARLSTKVVFRSTKPVFAAHLPRKKGLPPVRSGAIMKLQ
jgi:hypothetical protein